MPVARVPDDIEIYYEEHGEGEPVLLLMGTGADHTFWGPQIGPYSERFRTIVIDSRGTGRSTRPADPTTLGSAIAQEVALMAPERLLSLSLHGTWGKSDEWFIRAIDTLEVPALAGEIHRYLNWALMWVLSPRFLAEEPEAVADIVRTYIDENPYPPSGAGVAGHTHADKLHDTLERLGEIGVRTLVTAGEMDILVPPRYGEQVARAIPGARYHLFRGDFASHCACLEMADEWNALTLAFLAGDDVGEVLAPAG